MTWSFIVPRLRKILQSNWMRLFHIASQEQEFKKKKKKKRKKKLESKLQHNFLVSTIIRKIKFLGIFVKKSAII